MPRRQTKVRAITAMLGLLGATFASLAVAPSAAQARCAGVGTSITSTLNIGSAVAVRETPVAGTCNDNNYYQGTFQSNYAGWRASVWFERDGWQSRFGPYGTAVQYYSYSDTSTPVPGATAMHFCLDNGVTWYCGWGNNYIIAAGVTHNFTGLNHGF
ncbi:hypothetical protein [Salinispora arenicola]|uniref:hypothetical protein n=1 Tax=Salinispora arenicola TaxID=168697 RepID=UPI00039D4847|nr:hypothetical protein [Salinispora arenicola]